MVLSACLWACGDNVILPPDGWLVPPFRSAPHAPMPRVLKHKGIVLSSVQLVTLTFEGYAARDQVERFGDMVVGSTWYAVVGGEYGVRHGSQVQTAVVGPAPSSITRDQIAALIKQLIVDARVPPPSAVANQMLYLLYVPSSVTRSPDLARLLGYHQMVTLGGVRFPIAVVLDADLAGRSVPPTTTAAHQLINAVTDPYEPPNDGYYADPPMIDPWSLVRGEVADLCEGETPAMESGFELPRVYSDAASGAGKPPCKPFVPGDSWNDVTAEPSTMRMIPRGGSVTFELTGWSTEQVPDWKLRTRAADFSTFSEAEMQPELSDDMINNGTMVELTLHAPMNAPLGAAGGVYVLSGANLHPWAVGFMVR